MTPAPRISAARAPRELKPLLRFALDLGPLVLFFLVYALGGKNIFRATGIFMGCTAAAMIASRVIAGRISPMLWFSGAMVLLMGGATLLLHDESFIKMKPTLYYLMVAAILAFGLWSGRPTLELVLGSSFPGLRARGWQLLTRNWAVFFVVMAIANELVWRLSAARLAPKEATGFWLGYKLWGAMPATLLFGLANLPMLLRHGLNADDSADPELPPEGTVQ